MKTRISALMDGELEDHEVADTLTALKRSEILRSQWCECHLIGAALRGDDHEFGTDIVARVMSAIDFEPTVMAPAPRRAQDWRRPAMALAASAAGVALVSWLALAPGGGEVVGSGQLAAVKQGQVLGKVVAQAAEQTKSTPRLQEYLVAHQAYAPSGAMVGGARNIRTVAASGEGH